MASRESTLNLILDTLRKNDLVVACNGKLGRELFELRVLRGEPNDDFILAGAMGCALGVAIGIARNTGRRVICLLGDGNFLMKMGSLATFADYKYTNLHVYILNNECHDSTGGQPTAFGAIRHMLPIRHDFRVLDVEKGARSDLGRPTISPVQITSNFMQKCLSS